MKRDRTPKQFAPNELRRRAEVSVRSRIARVMPTYASRRSSSTSPSSSARECGNTPSSIPMMNTIGNSRPLALCIVISVTRPSSSRMPSASASRQICCRNSSTEPFSFVASYSRPTCTSSSRFSIRPWASIVRSASSASR